jgi:hypothetical protein
MSDRELLAEIRDVLATSPFVGEGHRKADPERLPRDMSGSTATVVLATPSACAPSMINVPGQRCVLAHRAAMP